VPISALQQREGQPGVFVADGGRARWRAVKPGVRGRDQVEITTGLNAGEWVATARDPRLVLSDGDRISGP
jgi:HlyD family secretion protein